MPNTPTRLEIDVEVTSRDIKNNIIRPDTIFQHLKTITDLGEGPGAIAGQGEIVGTYSGKPCIFDDSILGLFLEHYTKSDELSALDERFMQKLSGDKFLRVVYYPIDSKMILSLSVTSLSMEDYKRLRILCPRVTASEDRYMVFNTDDGFDYKIKVKLTD